MNQSVGIWGPSAYIVPGHNHIRLMIIRAARDLPRICLWRRSWQRWLAPGSANPSAKKEQAQRH